MSAIYDALQTSPVVYQETFQPPRGPVEMIASMPQAPMVTALPQMEPVYSTIEPGYGAQAYSGLDGYAAFVEAMPQLAQAPRFQAAPIATTMPPIMAATATGSSVRLSSPAVQYATAPTVSSAMMSSQMLTAPPTLGPVTYASPRSYASPPTSSRAEVMWPSSYTSNYAVGETVEVWSNSRQAWCPGWVKSSQGMIVDVDFQFPDGNYAGKLTSINGGEIRSPLSSPRRLSSFPASPAVNQVVRTVSSGSIPPTQVERSFSGNVQSTLPMASPLSPVVRSFSGNVQSALPMALPMSPVVTTLDEQQYAKDRLVEDLRQAIESQRREAEELRRQQTQLLYTNQEQARRLADLEALLHDMQSPDHHGHQRQLMHLPEHHANQRQMMNHERHDHHERGRPQRRASPERQESHDGGYPRQRSRNKAAGGDAGRIASQALALRPSEPTHHSPLLGGDQIDLSLQDWFDMNPDFGINIEKHKPGWYTFDKPINKKVFIKMVGDQVIVRAGGGHVELHKWLSGFRSRAKRGD